MSDFQLTGAAILHIENHIAKRGQGVGIKLSLKKTGCSGLSYVLDFVDSPDANDFCQAINETLNLYVAKKDIPYLYGTKIDYKQHGINVQFTFDNPNATGVCGCGESFTIKNEL